MLAAELINICLSLKIFLVSASLAEMSLEKDKGCNHDKEHEMRNPWPLLPGPTPQCIPIALTQTTPKGQLAFLTPLPPKQGAILGALGVVYAEEIPQASFLYTALGVGCLPCTLPAGKLFPITLSTVFWSDDPEPRSKSFLALEARSEGGSWDVLWISTCRRWEAHLDEVRGFPGDAALQYH